MNYTDNTKVRLRIETECKTRADVPAVLLEIDIDVTYPDKPLTPETVSKAELRSILLAALDRIGS